MNKFIVVFVLFAIPFNIIKGQKAEYIPAEYLLMNDFTAEQDEYISNEENISMFKVLKHDFLSDKNHRAEKIDCYLRYTGLFFKTLYSQVSSPIGYVGYYMARKKITKRIEQFYSLKQLENIENIGEDIAQGRIDPKDLKDYLGSWYYNLWLYGDTKQPVENGGVPEDYKPNHSMFVRRWYYSGLRNPRWNATYVNNYSADVVKIMTPYDTREDIATHNYGTGDTKLGMWLRWYVDKDGKWWFFYENTKRTNKNKGKLFYFGAVGLGGKEDGIYFNKQKKGKFEFSLNRTVTIDG